MPMDLTTTDDTARYVAEAALDRDLPDGKFAIASDRITIQEAIRAVGDAMARPLDVTRRGPLAELETWIAHTKATASSPMDYAPAQYQIAMESGQASLTNLANDRYPQIRPLRFREYLASLNLRARAPA